MVCAGKTVSLSCAVVRASPKASITKVLPSYQLSSASVRPCKLIEIEAAIAALSGLSGAIYLASGPHGVDCVFLAVWFYRVDKLKLGFVILLAFKGKVRSNQQGKGILNSGL